MTTDFVVSPIDGEKKDTTNIEQKLIEALAPLCEPDTFACESTQVEDGDLVVWFIRNDNTDETWEFRMPLRLDVGLDGLPATFRIIQR
jgi:hypothetical protein